MNWMPFSIVAGVPVLSAECRICLLYYCCPVSQPWCPRYLFQNSIFSRISSLFWWMSSFALDFKWNICSSSTRTDIKINESEFAYNFWNDLTLTFTISYQRSWGVTSSSCDGQSKKQRWTERLERSLEDTWPFQARHSIWSDDMSSGIQVKGLVRTAVASHLTLALPISS